MLRANFSRLPVRVSVAAVAAVALGAGLLFQAGVPRVARGAEPAASGPVAGVPSQSPTPASCVPQGRSVCTLNGNNTDGTRLTLDADASGNVSGVLSTPTGGQNMSGLWDAAAGRIMLFRTINPTNPWSLQVFTGYLFEGGSECIFAGSFEAFQSAGGRPQRNVFGWYARRTQ